MRSEIPVGNAVSRRRCGLQFNGFGSLRRGLPLLSVIGVLGILALIPIGAADVAHIWRLRFAHWLHYVGIGLLFIFLVLAQYLQIEGRMRLANDSPMVLVARSYGRLSILTEWLPAPAAVIVVVSGLRMICETSLSLQVGWLFWLVTIFGLMFWDGLLFFRKETSRMREDSAEALANGTATRAFAVGFADGRRDLALFLHFASFFFAFALGCLRPSCPTPFAHEIRLLDSMFAGVVPKGWAVGWAQTGTAIVVLLLALPILLCFRFTFRRFACVLRRRFQSIASVAAGNGRENLPLL